MIRFLPPAPTRSTFTPKHLRLTERGGGGAWHVLTAPRKHLSNLLRPSTGSGPVQPGRTLQNRGAEGRQPAPPLTVPQWESVDLAARGWGGSLQKQPKESTPRTEPAPMDQNCANLDNTRTKSHTSPRQNKKISNRRQEKQTQTEKQADKQLSGSGGASRPARFHLFMDYKQTHSWCSYRVN